MDNKKVLEISKKIMVANGCINSNAPLTSGCAWHSFPDAYDDMYYEYNIYLFQIVKKCLADNFPIQEYLLFEIPYADSEGTIIDFVNAEDYGNYHIKGMHNNIRCIDFWVSKDGTVIPLKTVGHDQLEVNTCSEALYLDCEML